MMVLMVTARSTLWLLMENLSSPQTIDDETSNSWVTLDLWGVLLCDASIACAVTNGSITKAQEGIWNCSFLFTFYISQNNQGPFGAKIIWSLSWLWWWWWWWRWLRSGRFDVWYPFGGWSNVAAAAEKQLPAASQLVKKPRAQPWSWWGWWWVGKPWWNKWYISLTTTAYKTNQKKLNAKHLWKL